jgi:hypothetical protein
MFLNRIERKYRNLFLKDLFRRKKVSIQEELFINELREGFQLIKIIDTGKLTGANLEWAENINRLRLFVNNCDPRSFLQWDVIRNTMFVGNCPFIIEELDALKNSGNFEHYWTKGIIETSFGRPTMMKKFIQSSGNLIHHCYHLLQFEVRTKIKISSIDFVFEFGGGYGSMYRLFKNLNFINKYLLFDLPEFSLLQKYYLKSIGFDVLTIDTFSKANSGVLCLSDIEELKDILGAINPLKKNLFIGTWSISETSVDVRKSIFPLLKNFNLFLMAYQYGFFKEVNNIEYFKYIQTEFSHLEWENYPIEHLPGNNYLIGKGI